MSLETKYFAISTPTDLSFVYQDLVIPVSAQTERLPNRVIVENPTNAKIFVKLMDKKSQNGTNEAVPIQPNEAKEFQVETEDKPFYRIGIRLAVAGSSVGIDVVGYDYEDVLNVTF